MHKTRSSGQEVPGSAAPSLPARLGCARPKKWLKVVELALLGELKRLNNGHLSIKPSNSRSFFYIDE